MCVWRPGRGEGGVVYFPTMSAEGIMNPEDSPALPAVCAVQPVAAKEGPPPPPCGSRHNLVRRHESFWLQQHSFSFFFINVAVGHR